MFEKLTALQKIQARELFQDKQWAALYEMYRSSHVYDAKLCFTCGDWRVKIESWTLYAIEMELI